MHIISKRIPIHSRIIDHHFRNCLGDDPFHDLLDHALFGWTIHLVGIIRLDLITQIPVAEQPRLGREKPLPPGVEKVTHPNVVFRNVLPGFSFRLRNRQVHVRWHALGKTLGQTSFRPLPPVPFRAVFQSLLQRSERKIQQHSEGQLVLKEVIEHVRGRIVASEHFVERKHRTEIEVKLLAEFPINLVHVSVELFQQTLKTIEHSVQRGWIAGKVGTHKLFKDG